MENYDKPVSLIGVDLDGTLLDSNKKVGRHTRDVINRLKEYGILFGIISGRPIESVRELCIGWGIDQSISFIAGINGGALYDMRTRQKDKWVSMKGSDALTIIDIYKGVPGIRYEAMVDTTRYVEWTSPEMQANGDLYGETEVVVNLREFLQRNDVDKLILRTAPEDQAKIAEMAKRVPLDSVIGFPSSNVLFEFMDPKINKGYGVDRLCEHFGLEHENVAVFGDESNDIEMLEKAGLGIAMANATEKARAAADVINPYSNDEDGIARYIEEFILPHQPGKLSKEAAEYARKDSAQEKKEEQMDVSVG